VRQTADDLRRILKELIDTGVDGGARALLDMLNRGDLESLETERGSIIWLAKKTADPDSLISTGDLHSDLLLELFIERKVAAVISPRPDWQVRYFAIQSVN
jgi:hypothetical protein